MENSNINGKMSTTRSTASTAKLTAPQSLLENRTVDRFSDYLIVDDAALAHQQERDRKLRELEKQRQLIAELNRNDEMERKFTVMHNKMKEQQERQLQKWADQREDKRVETLRNMGIDARPNYKPYLEIRKPRKHDMDQYNKVIGQLVHGADAYEKRVAAEKKLANDLRIEKEERYWKWDAKRRNQEKLKKQQEAEIIPAYIRQIKTRRPDRPERNEPNYDAIRRQHDAEWAEKLAKFLAEERERKYFSQPPQPPEPPTNLQFQLYKDGDCNTFIIFQFYVSG